MTTSRSCSVSPAGSSPLCPDTGSSFCTILSLPALRFYRPISGSACSGGRLASTVELRSVPAVPVSPRKEFTVGGRTSSTFSEQVSEGGSQPPP